MTLGGVVLLRVELREDFLLVVLVEVQRVLHRHVVAPAAGGQVPQVLRQKERMVCRFLGCHDLERVVRLRAKEVVAAEIQTNASAATHVDPQVVAPRECARGLVGFDGAAALQHVCQRNAVAAREAHEVLALQAAGQEQCVIRTGRSHDHQVPRRREIAVGEFHQVGPGCAPDRLVDQVLRQNDRRLGPPDAIEACPAECIQILCGAAFDIVHREAGERPFGKPIDDRWRRRHGLLTCLRRACLILAAGKDAVRIARKVLRLKSGRCQHQGAARHESSSPCHVRCSGYKLSRRRWFARCPGRCRWACSSPGCHRRRAPVPELARA